MRRAILTMGLLALLGAPLHAEEVTITGTVVGPDAEAIAGAAVGVMVTFGPSYEWKNTTSAEDGTFELTLDEAPPQNVTFVAVRAEEFAVGGARVDFEEPVEVRLSDDPASLTGTVHNEDGDSVEGAQVALMMVHREADNAPELVGYFVDWEHAPSAQTDAEGHFTVTDLPRGARAMLSVAADGYATLRAAGGLDDMPIVGREEPVTYTLSPEAAIAGRVTHEGEPVANVKLLARGHFQNRSISTGSATTDAEGRYEITDIGGGTYVVIVHSAPDGLVAAPIEDLLVEAGGRTEGVNFELAGGAVVRGRVTWEDTGEPVEGTTVASLRRGMVDSLAKTDEEGFYELTVAPGANRVSWMGDQNTVRGTEPEQHEVDLAPEEVLEGVDFALKRGRAIAVTVLGPNGEPAAGVSVYWDADQRFRRPGGVEPMKTDENGRVTVRFGREVHRWDNALHAALAQDVEAGLAGMTIIDGENDSEATVILREGAWASVSAQTREGEPVPDAAFRVRYRVGDEQAQIRDLPLQAATGEDGQVRIGPLPPGVPLAVAPTWEYARRTIEPQDTPMPSEQFQPGETREWDPFIMVPEGFTVRGTVIGVDGEPVDGALVVCGNTIEGRPAEVGTDADGRFELEGVSVNEETVVLIAASADGSAAWAEAVDPANAFQPTIQLGKPGTIEARVVGADGTPVTGLEVQVSAQSPTMGGMISLPGALKTFARDLRTDAEGRVRVEGLVPGVEYRLLYPMGPDETGWRAGDPVTVYGDGEVIEMTVTPGE